MAASIRGSVSQGFSTDNTAPYDMTVTLPTHQSGDLLLIFLMFDRGDIDPTSTPAGWTELTNIKSNNLRFQSCMYIFYREATSASESNPTFTLDEVFEQSYKFVAIAIQDQDGIDVYDTSFGTLTGAASIDAPAVTTTVNDCLVIRAMDHKDLNAATNEITATPTTQLWLNDGKDGVDALSPGHAGSYEFKTNAGDTGVGTFTGNLYRPVAITIAIKSAVATPPSSPPVVYETAWTSPGTVVEDSSYGDRSWLGQSNAKISDDLYATCDANSFPENSYYLKATNFGFTIPSEAAIVGIEASVERKASIEGTYHIQDSRLRIVDEGGTIGSDDKADTISDWENTDTVVTYGSSSDLWGDTWTAPDINNSNFGMVLSAYFEMEDLIAYVDHMQIKVYYTEASSSFMTTNTKYWGF